MKKILVLNGSFCEMPIIEKAKEMGKDETAQYIEKAIEYMQKANDMLTEAKKHM